jgi:hypothetical protein
MTFAFGDALSEVLLSGAVVDKLSFDRSSGLSACRAVIGEITRKNC